MDRLAARFLAPGPPERLAVLRILVGTYGVAWSLIRLPAHLGRVDQPGSRWQPIGVLSVFADPLPDAAIVALAVGTPLLGMLYVAGWKFGVSGPAFAVALLGLATLHSANTAAAVLRLTLYPAIEMTLAAAAVPAGLRRHSPLPDGPAGGSQ